jgi:hypothetical protein
MFSKEIEEMEREIMCYCDLPKGFIDKFREKFYQKMLARCETKTDDKFLLQECVQRFYLQALISLEQVCPERK